MIKEKRDFNENKRSVKENMIRSESKCDHYWPRTKKISVMNSEETQSIKKMEQATSSNKEKEENQMNDKNYQRRKNKFVKC